MFFYYGTNNKGYKKILEEKTNVIIEGTSAPRGRILDRSGKVLVDNVLINNLVFHYVKGMDMVSVAKKLANTLDFDDPTEKDLINFYKATNNINALLSNEEKRYGIYCGA